MGSNVKDSRRTKVSCGHCSWTYTAWCYGHEVEASVVLERHIRYMHAGEGDN